MEPSLIENVRETGGSSGMLFACWAIVIVLLAMVVVFMRAKKKDYALAVLPLTLVPFAHIISGVAIVPLIVLPFIHILSNPLAHLLDPLLPLTLPELRIAVDMTAGLVSCLLIGLTARHIRERRTRNAFMICCSGFLIILTLVLVVNSLVLVRV